MNNIVRDVSRTRAAKKKYSAGLPLTLSGRLTLFVPGKMNTASAVPRSLTSRTEPSHRPRLPSLSSSYSANNLVVPVDALKGVHKAASHGPKRLQRRVGWAAAKTQADSSSESTVDQVASAKRKDGDIAVMASR